MSQNQQTSQEQDPSAQGTPAQDNSEKTEAPQTEPETAGTSTASDKTTKQTPANQDLGAIIREAIRAELEPLKQEVYGNKLENAKKELPEGFNMDVLKGMDVTAQMDFISKFKAAMPKQDTKSTASKGTGATVPAKATSPTSGPPSGSMSERAAKAQELLKQSRGKGTPGIIAGGYHV